MSPAQSAATGPPAPAAGARRLVVDASRAGHRVDEVLASLLGIGRRACARLLPRVLLNGRPALKGWRVAPGDVFLVPADRPPAEVPAPDDVRGVHPAAEVTVVRETAEVLVVAKPGGLPSVSLAGGRGASVATWVAARFPACSAVGRPGEHGLVHRLDTGTSGLLLLARSPHAYRALRGQFGRREVEKSYLALVEGELRGPLLVDLPIGQHPKSRRRMRAVTSRDLEARYAARPAATAVEPLRTIGPATLVRARSASGARHQIRVHLAGAGHPLVGDELYGGSRLGSSPGYWLHAESLRWVDPVTAAAQEDRLPAPQSWRVAYGLLEALAGR